MAEATAKVERLQQEIESMKEPGSNDVLETGDQPQKSLSGTQQFHDIEWPIGILGNHFFETNSCRWTVGTGKPC